MTDHDCPYCQYNLVEYENKSQRTQHSHKREIEKGMKCTNCSYREYADAFVQDRMTALRMISKKEYEKMPQASMMMVETEERKIIFSDQYKNVERFQDNLERAQDEFLPQVAADKFYVIISEEVRMDGNHIHESVDLGGISSFVVCADVYHDI